MIYMVGRAWIFQANTKFYDIDNAIRHLKIIPWRVNYFKNEISKGDRVYLWRSEPNAGIIAIGTVISDLMEITLNQQEREYIVDKDVYLFKKPRLGVKVQIDVILEKPILKSILKSQSSFSKMSILRNPRGTNFRLSLKEVEAFNNLFRNVGAIG